MNRPLALVRSSASAQSHSCSPSISSAGSGSSTPLTGDQKIWIEVLQLNTDFLKTQKTGKHTIRMAYAVYLHIAQALEDNKIAAWSEYGVSRPLDVSIRLSLLRLEEGLFWYTVKMAPNA